MHAETSALSRELVGHVLTRTVAHALAVSRRVQGALETLLRVGAGMALSALGLPVEPAGA